MNQSPNNSFATPIKPHWRNGGNSSFGGYSRSKNNFSPIHTSSPRDLNSESPDFVPFGYNSSPIRQNQGRCSFGSGSSRRRNSYKSFSSNSSHSGFNNSFSPASRSSSPYSYNFSNGHSRGRRNMGRMENNCNGKHNMRDYYDRSMIQNPWAELEEELRASGALCSFKAVSESNSTECTAVVNDCRSVCCSDSEMEWCKGES